MVKIFVQNKPLLLVNNADQPEAFLRDPNRLIYDRVTGEAIDDVLLKLEGNTVTGGVMLHNDKEVALNTFKAHLTFVQAAGGLVCNADGAVLLIFRRGKWDLPKGKLDEGEDLEVCAIREVNEETGLAETQIVRPLAVTYHTYRERGRHILKESHWYLMAADGAAELTPQAEEDIEKCEWVPFSQLSAYTGNMHASIIEVLQEGKEAVKEGNV